MTRKEEFRLKIEEKDYTIFLDFLNLLNSNYLKPTNPMFFFREIGLSTKEQSHNLLMKLNNLIRKST